MRIFAGVISILNHMKRIIASFSLLVVTALAMNAQPQEKETIAYGDTVRTYAMYLPENMAKGAPLVVYTHGYGSKKRWIKDLNAAAEKHKFAVCYPDGAPDDRGKDGWFVGYPTQWHMDKNEEDFFAALLDEVCAKYALSRENVFMAGMSNGGDLCYQLAYTRPGLFKAYASVAGLTFEWMYNERKLTEPVHFLEIHGNADKVSMWQGDHENKGGWGAYIPVPLAASAIAANNRCTTASTDSFPTLSDSTRLVIHTVYGNSPSGKDVEVYEVQGAPHSWHAKDLPTSEIVWKFFEKTMK